MTGSPMIRLTKSQHYTNEAQGVDRRWFLDPTLRFEVHALPPVQPDQKIGYPGAGALVVVNSEAHFVDETVEQVLILLKIAREPESFAMTREDTTTIFPEDLLYIGMSADGVFEFSEIEGEALT